MLVGKMAVQKTVSRQNSQSKKPLIGKSPVSRKNVSRKNIGPKKQLVGKQPVKETVNRKQPSQSKKC
jgi:hypothetical protein